MSEKEIGGIFQMVFDFGLRVQDGVIFDVGTRDDDWVTEVLEDEVMEGC